MVHEHDHECGCGHHHHDEDTEHLHTNKYQQAFAKFEAAGTTEEVTGRVKTLLGKHGNDNFTPDVLKQIHGFIDLTSLTSIDTREHLETGRQGERFRRNPPRRTQRCRHLHLSPVC